MLLLRVCIFHVNKTFNVFYTYHKMQPLKFNALSTHVLNEHMVFFNKTYQYIDCATLAF